MINHSDGSKLASFSGRFGHSVLKAISILIITVNDLKKQTTQILSPILSYQTPGRDYVVGHLRIFPLAEEKHQLNMVACNSVISCVSGPMWSRASRLIHPIGVGLYPILSWWPRDECKTPGLGDAMCEDYYSSIPLPWIHHNKPVWKQGWLAMTSWLLHFNSKPTTLSSNWSLIIGFPVMWSKETATRNNVWKHVKLRFAEKLCFAKQRSLLSIFIDSRCSSYHIKN